jgi:sulfatase maturation enzyme AslB (radical SAM superfamily)
MKNIEKDFILFRFVPTMKCNYTCSYCFLSRQEKEVKEQMFDHHTPEEWIKGMENWMNHQVEFYMWGGEPFIMPDVYKVLSGWLSLPFVQKGNRIDTNTSFAEKILQEIPNNLLEKLSLNCSWHTESEELPSLCQK